jgi:hypothetical protein
MPNLNQLILTGADWKIFLSIPGGGTYPLKTTDSFSYNVTAENELIYAVGETEPIGNKANAKGYQCSLSMQQGEVNAILQIEGLQSMANIRNAVVGATAIQGGMNKTFTGVNIHSEAGDVKRKDKETLVKMDVTALSLINT